MKHQIEFANFHCTAGPYHLIELAPQIVLPALMSDQKRKLQGATYSLMGQTIVDAGAEGPCIAFEFVKDTRLRSEQARSPDGSLVQRSRWIADSPSALGVLVLPTHRLIYLPKTTHAPSTRELQSFCRWLFAQSRDRYRNSTTGSFFDGPSREDLEAIQVEIVPLVSATSIADFLRRLKVVQSVKFELFQTNAEYNPDRLFQQVEEARKASKARKALLELHAGNKKEGLDHDVTRRDVESALTNGTGRVVISGRDLSGQQVTQDNENLRLRVAPGFVPTTAQANALDMVEALAEQKDKTQKRAETAATIARWREAMKKFQPKP